MASEYILSRFVGVSLISIAMNSAFAHPSLDFTSPIGQEKWRMTGSPLRCGLSIVIPNYGIGYFEQYATKDPHFILRKWEEEPRKIPAAVTANPPSWKPFDPTYLIARAAIKPGAYGIFLPRDPALKLLGYLSQGYQIKFTYSSAQGFRTTVALSPAHFQKVYAPYMRCLGSLLPFDYNDIKQSVFHFGTESRALSDADKDELRRIAQYVEADNQVEVIQVSGYTDDSGRKGYNNAISEYRAKAVQKYLLGLGVPKDKLSVTWYGALKPIARNDTDEGRAANRRVVIDVFKK